MRHALALPLSDPLPALLPQALLDALSTATCVVDPQGTIVAVNAAWLAFMGRGGGQAHRCGVGANYLQVCDAASPAVPSEALDLAAGLRGVLRGTLPAFSLEYPCHSPERRAWYLARVTPVAGRGALPSHAVVVHEEVSARKRAEERQRDLTAEVEAAVGTRTAALQDANHELDLFASTLAHDLRAPVRHVTGFLNLLRRERGVQQTERERTLHAHLDAAADRMSRMIERLLALSRTSSARLDFGPVHLNALVEQVWGSLANGREGRDVVFLMEDLPCVQGDRDLLTLVFENLLSNATKYTRGTECARVELSCARQRDAWVITVRDNGAGFDPKYAPRLFTAFSRLHRQEDFEGIGMGLLNVKRIVERHGGRVWAHGQVGCGAAFHVLLPGA